MYKILFSFLWLIALQSCSSNDKVQIEIVDFEQKSTIGCVNKKCSEAVVYVPVVMNQSEVAKKINQYILGVVAEQISRKKETTLTYEQILSSFIEAYEQEKKQYPDDYTLWTALVNGSYTNFNDNVVNFVLDFYTFDGKAQPIIRKKSFFFSLENGELIPMRELFVNYVGFENLAKKKFYEKFGLLESKSLAEQGFVFPKKQFALSQHICFTKEQVKVYYYPGEVTYYSRGAIELEFNFNEVKPFLNPLYFL